MSANRLRQNFHEECEDAINKQINREMHASYVYLSMSLYFDRDDVALPGFSRDFKRRSGEEVEHAELLMKYQNKRGGRILLERIEKPEKDDWESGLEALKAALELEKSVDLALLDLRRLAEDHGDFQLCDFLDTTLLKEQVEDIKTLGDMIATMQRVGTGLGEYIFDREDMQRKNKMEK